MCTYSHAQTSVIICTAMNEGILSRSLNFYVHKHPAIAIEIHIVYPDVVRIVTRSNL